MSRFNQMQIFVAVAQQQGFSAAARQLRLSPPVVTRAIAELEARLGVRLLHRTTRHVRLTEAGQRYLNDAKRVLAAVDEADEAAIGIHAEPRGHLSITAPVLFGRMHVMPGIAEYLQRYPGMEVSALLVDRVVNLMEEGIDVAIRIGELQDSSYQALRLGEVKRVWCASPEFLAVHGTPRHPSQFGNHQVIVINDMSERPEWHYLEGNKKAAVKLAPRLRVTSNDSAIEAAGRGVGITQLLSYQVAHELAAGTLKALLGKYALPPLPINILHREGRHSAAKIRAFIDLMASQLRGNNALAGGEKSRLGKAVKMQARSGK